MKKIFEDQPVLTNKLRLELTNSGWLVPDVTRTKGLRRVNTIKNKTQGHVVSYNKFARKLARESLSQEQAKALILIELERPNGPRQSHIKRLIPRAVISSDLVLNLLNK